MNAKFFGALLAAPLAVASAMIMAAPASAAVFFNNGDLLNIGGGFAEPVSPGSFQFIKVDGSTAAIDGNGYGNFGIFASPKTKGSFAFFSSNGAENADYKILNVNFANVATYLNKDFLSVSKGGESFKFVITEPVITRVNSSGFYAADLVGRFESGNKVLGKGKFTSQFFEDSDDAGSYSATFKVTETVPEPSALLGLGLMVGTVFIIRRSQEVSA